jgi:hypothetical protein
MDSLWMNRKGMGENRLDNRRPTGYCKHGKTPLHINRTA